jgi:hypothetical protein
MLGSAHDGERAAAALKADQHVRGLGLCWHDVIAPAEAPEPQRQQLSWQELASAVLSSGRATAWEANFCESLLRSWRGPEVTRKQRQALEKVFARCAGCP